MAKQIEKSKKHNVLKYTKCIDIWLADKGEYKTLEEYDNYVKNMIREKNLNHIKTLSDWLIDTNIELFSEYDSYVENIIRNENK